MKQMRVNENLSYIDQHDYVVIKNEVTGAVVRVTRQAAELLHVLQANDFNIDKAICEIAETTGNVVEADAVQKFIDNAVALNIIIPDDGGNEHHLDWSRRPILSRTIIRRESVIGAVLGWVAKKRYLIHPTITFSTVAFVVHMAFIARHYIPGLNGQTGFAILFFIGISFFHEIGHWLFCEFFGGSVAGLGIGIAYGAIPYFWTDLGNIWFLDKRIPRVLSLLGGIWLELWLSGLLVVILLLVQKKTYIAPVLLVLVVRMLLDTNPFYSDLSLVRREISGKRRYAFVHMSLWILATIGVLRWMHLI